VLGDASRNLELAIGHLEQAPSVFSPDLNPKDYGLAANAMAVVLMERLEGGRAENIERAIDLYERALAVRPRTEYPAWWAQTQANLAFAFNARTQGDRKENLRQVIVHGEATLEVMTEQNASPPDLFWQCHRMLTEAYLESDPDTSVIWKSPSTRSSARTCFSGKLS
jgi:hypothetical protein